MTREQKETFTAVLSAILFALLLSVIGALAWQQWAMWVDVRNFVVPIMRREQAQQQKQQAPQPAPQPPVPSTAPAK